MNRVVSGKTVDGNIFVELLAELSRNLESICCGSSAVNRFGCVDCDHESALERRKSPRVRSFEAGVAGAVEQPDAQLQGFLGIPTQILAPV